MSTPSPTDILLSTRSLLRYHGWTQGKLIDDRGRMCLGNAIGHAAQALSIEWDPDPCGVIAVTRGLVIKACDQKWPGIAADTIPEFNDVCAKEFADIEDVINRAILLDREDAKDPPPTDSAWGPDQVSGGLGKSYETAAASG